MSLMQVALAACVSVLLVIPAVAQINPGAISNESRRQEQRMQRDLERQWRTQTGPFISEPVVKRPAPRKPRQRRPATPPVR